VIIVLGEVIVGAVDGMAAIRPIELDELVIGLLGVVIAIGLWWIYFDLVSHRAPRSRFTQLWLNLHFPLVVAMAAGGAGVLNTVEHAGEPVPEAVRWMLAGSLAVAMVSIAILARTLEVARERPELFRTAVAVLLASAALCLGVGMTDWGAKGTLSALAVLLLVPVGAGIVVWLRHVEPAQGGPA
jgi:low temperature requirement protein LtrA